MIELVLILAALAAAYALVNWYPNTTRRWFGRFMAARQVFLGAVAVIIAFVFVGSGYPPLMIVGFLMFLYLGLYVFFENPHEEVRGWL